MLKNEVLLFLFMQLNYGSERERQIRRANTDPKTDTGVYALGRTLVLVVRDGREGQPYVASKPNMNLRFNPAMAESLRVPTDEQRDAFLRDPSTVPWLTERIGLGPEAKRVIDDFLETN